MNKENIEGGKIMSNENNKTTLTEEQLEQAAGGIWKTGCWFVHKNGIIRKRTVEGYLYEAECASNCHEVWGNACKCHGYGDICINKWHAVTENGSPLPRNDNHKHWYS